MRKRALDGQDQLADPVRLEARPLIPVNGPEPVPVPVSRVREVGNTVVGGHPNGGATAWAFEIGAAVDELTGKFDDLRSAEGLVATGT